MEADNHREEIPWQSQTPDGQVLLSMPWEIFVLGAALLSIVNLALGVFLRNPDLCRVVVFIDALLIVIFAVDLLRRLRVADDNRAYLVQGHG